MTTQTTKTTETTYGKFARSLWNAAAGQFETSNGRSRMVTRKQVRDAARRYGMDTSEIHDFDPAEPYEVGVTESGVHFVRQRS